MSNIFANEKLITFGEQPRSVINPDPCSRAWVEVNSKAIESNARCLKKFISDDCLLMAVVKADGYGHGAETVAKGALTGGGDSLGGANRTGEDTAEIQARQKFVFPLLLEKKKKK